MIKFGWLMWSDFKTTRFDHHSEHLWILGFCMMDGHSYLDISVISCKLRTSSSKLSRAISGSCQSLMASWMNCSGWRIWKSKVRAETSLYQWLNPRLWLFTLRATSSWKELVKAEGICYGKKTMKTNYYTLSFNIWHIANLSKIELNFKGNCPELATVYHIPESFQAPLRWSVLSSEAAWVDRSAPRGWDEREQWRGNGPGRKASQAVLESFYIEIKLQIFNVSHL